MRWEQEVTWRSPVGDQLETSLNNLDKNGFVSVKAALSGVISKTYISKAYRFASDAKQAFAPPFTALRHLLSSLHTGINSAPGQAALATGAEVVSPVTAGPASEELYVEPKLPRLAADGLAHA